MAANISALPGSMPRSSPTRACPRTGSPPLVSSEIDQRLLARCQTQRWEWDAARRPLVDPSITVDENSDGFGWLAVSMGCTRATESIRVLIDSDRWIDKGPQIGRAHV